MARYFEGTSTGTKYEVGKQYQTGDGRVLTAQPDGSFRKDGNLVGYTDQGRPVIDNVGEGSVSRGSSTDASVEWYASGKDLAEANAGLLRGSPASQASSAGAFTPGKSAGTDSSGNAVMSVPRSSLAAMWAQADRSGGWSGKDDPPQDNLIGGFHWMASPKWTNAELFEGRYGEVGETLIGLAVLGADVGYNARRLWDAGGKAMVEGAIVHATKPETVDGWVGSFMDWRDQLNADVAAQNQRNAAIQAMADADADAWDAREQYQREEALKGGDWTAIPGVSDTWDTRAKNEFHWGTAPSETWNPATNAWY